MTFRVGQKVVCVDDVPDKYRVGPKPLTNDMHGLTAGSVYTVQKIELYELSKSGAVVHLAEINRGFPIGYDIARFRPAVDIQQFRDLVAPIFAGKKVSA